MMLRMVAFLAILVVCVPATNALLVTDCRHSHGGQSLARPSSFASTADHSSSLLASSSDDWGTKRTNGGGRRPRRPISRRKLLLTKAALTVTTTLGAVAATRNKNNILPTVIGSTAKNAVTGGDNTLLTMMDVPQAIEWIDQNCDRRFLHAVVASDYHFLYRGVPDNMMSIRNEQPDLLDPETYGDSTGAVVRYFRNLEELLSDDAVRPSNGHLATTSVRDAAVWGQAASIWPVSGDDAHYAWFHDGGLFYPRPSSTEIQRQDIIVDGRDCGKDSLEDALRGDSWEVLVAAKSFLAVPAALDEQLRQGLQQAFLV